jgi:hypothetical protein
VFDEVDAGIGGRVGLGWRHVTTRRRPPSVFAICAPAADRGTGASSHIVVSKGAKGGVWQPT